MNGRVYDPVLGRFLSADPFVQDANDTQALNRYTYAHNNPLSYTDPSGFFFKKIWNAIKSVVQGIASFISNPRAVLGIAVAILAPYALGPALVGLGSYASFASSVIGGALSGAITSGSLEGALHGAVTAGLFYGVGDLTMGHFYESASGWTNGFNTPDEYFLSGMHFANIAGHAAVGCASNVAAGGKCGAGALSTAAGAIAGPKIVDSGRVAATAMSAAVGGTASVIGGDKFANGAVTAAFGYLFNDAVWTYAENAVTRLGSSSDPMAAMHSLQNPQYLGINDPGSMYARFLVIDAPIFGATILLAPEALAIRGLALAVRADIVLAGGRGGILVKGLVGPANSVSKRWTRKGVCH